jgi:Region found in RelA / SpoT proteins
MTERIKSEYSRSQIDKSAELLLPWWTDLNVEIPVGGGFAYHIINNWRTSHAMPLLTFRSGLEQRIDRLKKEALVVQRQKRFASVMNKLVRETGMRLTQMQDLGGCRAIMKTVADVEALSDLYKTTSGNAMFAEEGSIKARDYIRNPKPDGYRGVHLVGRYSARVAKNEPWNGHRIEIQLRSQLQHAFATAVETVTTFTRSPLKFGGGQDDWKRFFSLVGSALAIRENTALVPGAPSDEVELLKELKELTKRLRVQRKLKGWSNAMKRVKKKIEKGTEWLLLMLDVQAEATQVLGFPSFEAADEVRAGLEKARNPDLDVVLVWIGAVANLKKAYPNYYADTNAFVDALDVALSRHP